MISQTLAQGIVGISADMTAFKAGIAQAQAMLQGLGAGGIGAGMASGVASGMAQGVARGSSQARNAMGQFTSQAVAGGMAAGMAQGASRARGAVGSPLTQAVAQATAAGMAQGIRDAGGRLRDARGRFAGMGGAGGGGSGGGGGAGGFGLGALQGLGLSGFATSPGMAAGQMAGGALRAGWDLVADGIKESAKTAIDLQSTFLDMQRVTGGTAENTQNLKKAVFDIANKQAGVSVADVTGIMMGAAKAGVGDKEGPEGLVRFTRGIARIKNAMGEKEGLDADALTESMTQMMNLFHLGTESAEGLGSALVKMANASTGSGSSILQVARSLSGTLASLGSDAAMAMSIGSVVADVGLTPQQGGNSLSQILRMMASDTKGLAESTGIPLKALQDQIRTDVVGALEMVVAKFKEINEVDPIKGQEFIASLGFEGVRTAGAFQQIASQIDLVQKRAALAREEMRNLTALTSADTLKSEATQGGLQKLDNALVELKGAVGDHFLPGIDMGTEALTGLARAAAGNVPKIMGGIGDVAKAAVGSSGAAGTAATAAAPGLLGWLFGDTGATSAPAIPGKATRGFVGPPRPVDAEAEANRKAVQEGWALAARGMGPPAGAGMAGAGRRFLDEMTAVPSVGAFDAGGFAMPGIDRFGGPDLQSALSKDPAEAMVERQDKANTFLERISMTLLAGAGTTPDRQRRGPLIMTGEA